MSRKNYELWHQLHPGGPVIFMVPSRWKRLTSRRARQGWAKTRERLAAIGQVW